MVFQQIQGRQQIYQTQARSKRTDAESLLSADKKQPLKQSASSEK